MSLFFYIMPYYVNFSPSFPMEFSPILVTLGRLV